MFADVLFYTAQIDSQLELKEKSYDKVNRWARPMTRPMARPRARPGPDQWQD